MSRSGRTHFTETLIGSIRAFKYPLSIQKEWVELQVHSSPITKELGLSEFIGNNPGLRRNTEVTYTEEILITQSDLQDEVTPSQNQMVLELKMCMEELKIENAYQLRLKDISYSENIKELNTLSSGDRIAQLRRSASQRDRPLTTTGRRRRLVATATPGLTSSPRAPRYLSGPIWSYSCDGAVRGCPLCHPPRGPIIHEEHL
ncbi:hypothetical protein DPEC_G00338250 [Dallia pectoralis]|uniref:Uncharacterized protein n=1 Tax=Dallia pectoralis TaxID=75939 RepID=A0ACC2F4H1_DALPE|nr:hypothetical protein DPEC_G00338250 [Dallia pectoralis]